MQELGEITLLTLSEKIFTQNPFRRNHAKLIVQLLFCVAFYDDKKDKMTACLQSVFSVFRAQCGASYLFQKESGIVSYKDLVEEWPNRLKSLFIKDAD